MDVGNDGQEGAIPWVRAGNQRNGASSYRPLGSDNGLASTLMMRKDSELKIPN